MSIKNCFAMSIIFIGGLCCTPHKSSPPPVRHQPQPPTWRAPQPPAHHDPIPPFVHLPVVHLPAPPVVHLPVHFGPENSHHGHR
jgi:hypothetical protein